MLPDIRPGNTKILYFFNCLLDGMHTNIPYICDFSRGVLNVRSTRSHPTLAPRPQIWLMNFTGFCTVAGEDELNGKWEDWGTEADVFCLLGNDWEQRV